MELDDALELVERLSRTQNYPKDKSGLNHLAEGLIYASDTFDIPGSEIIAECAQVSNFCPTDHDLIAIARNLGQARDRKAIASLSSQPHWMKPERCAVCHDTGWRQFTREVFCKALNRKESYDFAERCPAGCAIPDPWKGHLTPEALR
jgi:hypothetical protein